MHPLKHYVNEVHSPHASSPSVAEAEHQHAATGLETLVHWSDHRQPFSSLCCQLQRWRQRWTSKTVRNRSMQLSKMSVVAVWCCHCRFVPRHECQSHTTGGSACLVVV